MLSLSPFQVHFQPLRPLRLRRELWLLREVLRDQDGQWEEEGGGERMQA